MEITPINYCKFIDYDSDDEKCNTINFNTAENNNNKKPPKFECTYCDVICSKQVEWNRHISTTKHINRSQNIKVENKRFECKKCNFICSKESDWLRHIKTRKHKTRIDSNENALQKPPLFVCDICNKEYKANSSLWYHKKSCFPKLDEPKLENTMLSINDNSLGDLNVKEIIIDLLKQNKDLQTQIIEISKESKVTNITNNNITNNSTNNTTNNTQFNLNMFLNETCKNALNIDDFMDSLQVTVEDLIQTGKLGFVQGMTRIFLKGLKDLDVTKRPFHCTDLKRETVYIKDQDTWEKETTEKKLMKQALNQVVRKNLKMLPVWQREHPDYLDHQDYISIAKNSLGSEYTDEQQRMDEKIIRNVLKEVMLDKKNCLQELDDAQDS